MNRVKRVNIFFLVMLIMQIIASFIVGYFVRNIINLSEEQLKNPEILLAILGSNQIIFIFIPVLVYIIITKQSVKDVLKLNKVHIKDIFFSFLIAILFLPTMMILSAITQLFSSNDVAQILSYTSQGSVFASLFVIAGFPAFFEEFIMRGVVLSEYKNVSIKKAAIMNGVLFAMLHLNIQQSLYALAMGALVSYLVYYTKSIFTSMTFHFTVNGINVCMAWFALRNAPSSGTASAVAQSNMPQSLIIIGIVIAFILLFAIAIGTFTLIILLMKSIKKRNIDKWHRTETSVNDFEEIQNKGIFEKQEIIYRSKGNVKNAFFKDVFNIPFVFSILVYLVGVFIIK